jgi:hypothetical protein
MRNATASSATMMTMTSAADPSQLVSHTHALRVMTKSSFLRLSFVRITSAQMLQIFTIVALALVIVTAWNVQVAP